MLQTVNSFLENGLMLCILNKFVLVHMYLLTKKPITFVWIAGKNNRLPSLNKNPVKGVVECDSNPLIHFKPL